MTNDGKIYIIVTDKIPSENQASINNNQIVNNTPTKQSGNLLKHWAQNNMIDLVKSTVNKAIMYQLSNVGNFTGNYMAQTHINNALSNLSSLTSIGTSALSGFLVTGSPIGALMGASLSLINSSVNGALNMNTLMIQNRQTNYEIAQLRDRAGLNSLKDNSRGTEN